MKKHLTKTSTGVALDHSHRHWLLAEDRLLMSIEVEHIGL